MKKLYTIILVITSIALLGGCATLVPSDEIMQKHRCDVIIDVRTPEEFSEKHLRYALSMPVDTIEEDILDYDIPKDTRIGVYCKRGVRAENARMKLQKLGYKNVYNLGSLRRLERMAGEKSKEPIAPKQSQGFSIF